MRISFQNMLSLVFGIPFMLVVAVAGFIIFETVERTVSQRVTSDLSTAATVFERLLDDRVREMRQTSALLSQDFGFRQAVATRDTATVLSALENVGRRAPKDASVVTDTEGNLLASLGSFDQSTARAIITSLTTEGASSFSENARVLTIDDQLYAAVIFQLRAPIPIGWYVGAIVLDSDTAEEIEALSAIAMNVAFMAKKGDGTWSTLAQVGDDETLGALNRPDLMDFADQGHIWVGNEKILLWWNELGEDQQGQRTGVLLSHSESSALAPFTPLFNSMFFIAAVVFAIAITGSFLVARRISRPLQRLAGAANEIARGDYKHTERQSINEFAQLSNGFNTMVDAVKSREQAIRQQAYEDPETGLQNRLGLERAVRNMCGEMTRFHVVIAEIEGFRTLRTALSDRIANKLIEKVADSLSELADTRVCRVSTSSIGFCIVGDRDENEVPVAMQEMFVRPLDLDDLTIDIRLRTGVACFPEHAETVEDLVRGAVSAVGQASTQNMDYAIYSPDLDDRQTSQLGLMSELREAIGTDELQLFIHPKMDVATGRFTSAEGLLRWFSKKHGFVPPDTFITVAESTGDIRYITPWVLETAMVSAVEMRRLGIELSIGVNLSANDLVGFDLQEKLRLLLEKTGATPDMLTLEVTESAVMTDMDRALATLDAFSEMGFDIALDDYGTGYSSLSYLKRLPVDELKIDKSFVQKLASDEEDNILVRSTIDLGHNLGLKVTAEGVEDQESIRRLREYGCDYLQGFHFTKPLPFDDAVTFLKNHQLSYMKNQ